MDDTVHFRVPQRFGEATRIPANDLRSVIISPSPVSVNTTAAVPIVQPVPVVVSSTTTIELRRVPVAKYNKLTQSSVDIANKYSVSLGDKIFENVNQLEKALYPSCLFTLFACRGISAAASPYNQQRRQLCNKQRYYLDLAKSRGRIGLIASQQCLYQLSILCK